MKKIIYIIISLFVISCQTEYITIEEQSGTLTAKVMNEGVNIYANLPTAPVKGAVVEVIKNGQIVASDSTDIIGNVCIANLAPGDYQVEVSHKNSKKIKLEVQIKAKKITVLKNSLFDCIFLPENEVEKKQWTVIHFVNLSDIQLEKDLISDIRMIEKSGGSGDNVNHIVYAPATGNYLTKSFISYLTKPNFEIKDEELFGDKMPTLFSPSYIFENYTYSDADPSDYKLLERSINEICELFPSDSIMLFIYDHGSGIDINLNESGAPHTHARSISGNGQTGGEITIPQLRETLENVRKAGHRVNVLVMGACTMASFEVGYELKDCGLTYLIASEPQALGLNYGADTWVEDFNNGTISTFEACRRIIEGTGKDNIFALWNMTRFDELTTLFNKFAKEAAQADAAQIKPLVEKSMKITKGGTPPELTYSCYDLADFAKNIMDSDSKDLVNLKEVALALYNFLSTPPKPENFIAAFHNPWQGDYKRQKGIGVLLRAPDKPYEGHNKDVYRFHKYYTDGNKDWDSFLMKLDNVSK